MFCAITETLLMSLMQESPKFAKSVYWIY